MRATTTRSRPNPTAWLITGGLSDYGFRVYGVHEAGHAIAGVLRGGTLLEVSFDPNREPKGLTTCDIDSVHENFFTYAGPWCEARWIQKHPNPNPDAPGGLTDEQIEQAVWLASDREGADTRWLNQSYDESVAARGGENSAAGRAYRARIPGMQRLWQAELERVWGAVEYIGERVGAQTNVTHDEVAWALEVSELQARRAPRTPVPGYV